MRKIILLVILGSLFFPKANAQYWDWVIDEKASAAFIENYGTQMVKLGEWLAMYKLIEEQQKQIAEKVSFIHMVRDSLFKSLQDVDGVLDNVDKKMVDGELALLNNYYTLIKLKTDSIDTGADVWKQYEKYVINHTDNILAMSKMAQGGGDEKNLLDKQQRLALLNYVVGALRVLRNHSRLLYSQLEVAAHYNTLKTAFGLEE